MAIVGIIKFLGRVVWSSEDDEREFIEAENEYEPLGEYLKRVANSFIKQAISQKYRFNKDDPSYCDIHNGKCECLTCRHDDNVCVDDPCSVCDGLASGCEMFKGESPQIKMGFIKEE